MQEESIFFYFDSTVSSGESKGSHAKQYSVRNCIGNQRIKNWLKKSIPINKVSWCANLHLHLFPFDPEVFLKTDQE